jgi:hypothetical protein
LQGRKTCTKKFPSARREKYHKLDKTTTNVNDTLVCVNKCHKKLQRKKEEIILNNCKLQEEKTYLKKIENVDYMCLGICKEGARHCKEKEKTYQTIVIYCMKRGDKERT